MSAYWIAHVDVTDADVYGEYAILAGEAIAIHGGKFLARGGKYLALEGNCRPRNVVVEFNSFEDAVACYNSDTYKRALQYSGRSSNRDILIVDGV